jgi:hypothetical protein
MRNYKVMARKNYIKIYFYITIMCFYTGSNFWMCNKVAFTSGKIRVSAFIREDIIHSSSCHPCCRQQASLPQDHHYSGNNYAIKVSALWPPRFLEPHFLVPIIVSFQMWGQRGQRKADATAVYTGPGSILVGSEKTPQDQQALTNTESLVQETGALVPAFKSSQS